MASLQEVTQELQTQTKSIDSLVSVIEKQIKRERSGAGDELEARLKAGRSKGASSGPTTFKGGLIDAVKGDLGVGFLGNLLRWAVGGISGALGALGVGKYAAMLMPGLGAMIGRLITRGPLGVALLLFGETLLTKAFDGIDEYITISEEDKKLYAASMSSALTKGVIASIFNKKLGIAVFFGSLLADSIRHMFPEDMPWKKKMELFGLELPFTNENFLEYGSIIASFFGASLITTGIKRALGIGSVAAATGGASAARAGFFAGFKPKKGFLVRGAKMFGWAGLIALGGSALADAVEAQTGNMTAANIVGNTANIMSIASMFGPTGLLIGAIASVGLAGATIVADYFENKRKELKKEILDKVAVDIYEAEEALENLDVRLAGRKAAIAAGELGASVSAMELIAGGGVDPTLLNALQDVVDRGTKVSPEAFRNAEAQLAQLTADRSLYGKDALKNAQVDMNAIYQRLLNSPLSDALKIMPKEQLRGVLATEMQRYASAGPLQDLGVLDQILDEFIDTAPGRMTVGTPVTLSKQPVAEDFKSWWKGERKEKYDFQKALTQYRLELEALMPPPQIQSGMGMGGGYVNMDNRITNTGSVTYSQPATTVDKHNGGAMRFHNIGD